MRFKFLVFRVFFYPPVENTEIAFCLFISSPIKSLERSDTGLELLDGTAEEVKMGDRQANNDTASAMCRVQLEQVKMFS